MLVRGGTGDRGVARGFFVVAGLGSSLFGTTVAAAQDFDGPKFQRGLWQFERTLAHVGSNPAMPAATYLVKSQVTRCVNPTEAMRETFRPTTVGNCRSAKPERSGNRYVFSVRCDFIGPVRTVIDVESETAYTESNESTVGKFKKQDIVVARRLGDCGHDLSEGGGRVEAAVR